MSFAGGLPQRVHHDGGERFGADAGDFDQAFRILVQGKPSRGKPTEIIESMLL